MRKGIVGVVLFRHYCYGVPSTWYPKAQVQCGLHRPPIHAVEALRVQSGVRKASTSQLWPLVGIISDLTYEGVGSGPEPTSRLDLAVA